MGSHNTLTTSSSNTDFRTSTKEPALQKCVYVGIIAVSKPVQRDSDARQILELSGFNWLILSKLTAALSFWAPIGFSRGWRNINFSCRTHLCGKYSLSKWFADRVNSKWLCEIFAFWPQFFPQQPWKSYVMKSLREIDRFGPKFVLSKPGQRFVSLVWNPRRNGKNDIRLFVDLCLLQLFCERIFSLFRRQNVLAATYRMWGTTTAGCTRMSWHET